MFQLEEEDDQQATFYRHVGFKFFYIFFYMPCACIVVFLHADAENQGSSEKRPLRRVKLQKLWGLSSPFLHIIQQSKLSVDNIFHPLLDEPADLLRKSGGHLQLYFLPQTY